MSNTRAVAWLLAIVMPAGCATATVKSGRTMTPVADLIPQSANTNRLPKLFRQGNRPQHEVVKLAQVSAVGNAYATHEDLEAKLLAEAAAIGADCLVVTHEDVIQDQIAIHPRGGLLSRSIMNAQGRGDMSVISKPVLYGVACRQATASLGTLVDDNGNVQYVRQGSAAEKAGLKEGMRLLAINETFIRADEFVWEREILTKTPGDVVQIEVIDLDGGKVRMTAVLDEAKQAEVRVAQASIATPAPPPTPPSDS